MIIVININRWLITGDTHQDFSRFKNYEKEIQEDEHTAIIILGDAALNWDLNENDDAVKDILTRRYKFHIYCVRGNHEARPQDVPGMKIVYDDNVGGEVYIQDQWPTIHYFKDWGIYTIAGFKVAVIGGAYSVDKYYRLANNYTWFDNEQLTEEEMFKCFSQLNQASIDFVFSHTCPLCWEPTDLFLRMIDQNTVDKTTEIFLENLGKSFYWKIWLFGHYHHDRLERPGVEQFFKNTENIIDIWDRWNSDKELDWWMIKSPLYYADDELLRIRDDYFKGR